MYVKYEVVGSQHVAVPTHFYKMVVGENQDGSLEMECYVMENTAFLAAYIKMQILLRSAHAPTFITDDKLATGG
ncbi:hypothetical protein YQE_02599, partial [Dendroctonus ponderosae]